MVETITLTNIDDKKEMYRLTKDAKALDENLSKFESLTKIDKFILSETSDGKQVLRFTAGDVKVATTAKNVVEEIINYYNIFEELPSIVLKKEKSSNGRKYTCVSEIE